MSLLVENVISFIVVFIFIFLLQYNFFIKPKIKKNSEKENSITEKKIIEIDYLSWKFNIDKEILLNSKVGLHISLINSFIISFVYIIINLINTSVFFRLMIGFVLLIFLIYLCNELYGRYLVKKISLMEEE